MTFFEITVLFVSGLFAHWIGDFILQSDYQAKNKATSISTLFEHVVTYTFTMMIWSFIFIEMCLSSVFLVGLLVFVTHFITDFFTSKVNKKFWDSGKHHNFFCSVGFDQLLHYIALYWITWYVIFGSSMCTH